MGNQEGAKTRIPPWGRDSLAIKGLARKANSISGWEQLGQFHGQHHVAFGAQLAAHERLHAVGAAVDDALQGFAIHHQGHLGVRVFAFQQFTGAVLDDQRKVLGVVDAETEDQVQTGSIGQKADTRTANVQADVNSGDYFDGANRPN